MTEYGHRHLKFIYRKLLSIDDNGFEFKDKQYSWEDIKKIKRYDNTAFSLLLYQAGTPRAYIYLNDGNCIKIKGRVLEMKNIKPTHDFISGRSNAYNILLRTFENKKPL